MRMTTLLSALVALAATSALAQSIPPAPVAPVEPVVDDYFGTKVTDPYRWMEDRTAPRFVAWARAEDDHARGVLNTIPGRERLLQRVAAHTGGGVLVGSVKLAGGMAFYGRRNPGENSVKLYVRDAKGVERLLVDPDAVPTTGPHYALDYYAPSPDGRRVAYGISPGGSENSVIHIIDVATGKASGERIDRAEFGAPSWLPDGSGFFYTRGPKLAADASELARYQNTRSFLHRVGTDPESDRAVAGTGVAGSVALTPVDTPVAVVQAGSPWAVMLVSHGADPAVTLYTAPIDEVARGGAHWRLVADTPDGISNFQIHGRRLFLQSFKGASRYQVLEVDAAAPDLAHAKVVVPAGQRVIQDINLTADALVITDLDGGLGRIRRLDLKSGKLSDLALPHEGAVTAVATDPASPRLVYGLTGWVSPVQYFRSDGAASTLTDLAPPLGEDLSAYTAEEVTVTARDGTAIPLSIVYRKGLKRDGSHPVWLTGYGAYGAPLNPGLASRFFALLDDGGVYAVAHVRGGGEFGEDWHQAGRMATKPNTWRDLIAAGEYLTTHGYGRPETLAIEGRSAGGITVGRAMTERPDLFRVVFFGVGDANPLRSEFGTDGPANALEYGSARTEAGFRALFEMDSVHHVKDGTAYPAVLLTSGMNDPRVAPWQPGKFAARLQAANPNGRPILFRVDFDAGHGIGSTKAQRDAEVADQMAFFYWQIGWKDYQPK